MSVLNIPNVRHIADITRCSVPAGAMAVHSLPRVEYSDAYQVPLPPGRRLDAEGWARAVFDLRSPAVGTLLRAIGLGLGASPVARSPRAAVKGLGVGRRVWGWDLVYRASDAVCLEMLTRLGLVQIVILTEPDAEQGRLTMSTFIAYSGPAGRAAFTHLVGPAHRRVVPLLLAHAVAGE